MGKNTHLNSTVARFKLNQKPRIGDSNEAISLAMPLTEEEWADYYHKNVRSESGLTKLRQFSANEVLMLIVTSSWIEMDSKQVLAIGGVRCIYRIHSRSFPGNSNRRSEDDQ